MIDILPYLPARRKKSASGWLSFNAPCCVHNGETADRRQRGGLLPTDQGWSYHCFNCGFKTSFVLGRNLSFKTRRLLQWLNVAPEEIERINLESMRHRSMHGLLQDRQRTAQVLQDIDFDTKEFPTGFEVIDPERHPRHWQYLRDRCVPQDYPVGVVPWASPDRACVTVPFTWHGNIVGLTSRFLDDRIPKYIHDIQPGYVFGTDLISPDWQHVLVMEGVFDALSIGGLAVLHADISDAQVRVIRSLDRAVTVVPDQDEAGLRLIDRALELGWAVSVPEWPPDVKDVNDAVRRFGRLAALITIMQARETSRIRIELRKKHLVKRIRA